MAKPTEMSLPSGSLDLLVLQTLEGGPRHGYQIARHIHATSKNALTVEEGSLYPALHRLERRGWVTSKWGVSEANRRAKFYQLTRNGRSQLKTEVAEWRSMVAAIGAVIDAGKLAPRTTGEG